MPSDEPSASRLTILLERLADAGVEFVLVGGLAAVSQGATITTVDVDIVHARTEENVDRLLGMLTDIAAHNRFPKDKRLPPDRASLLGRGHNLYATDLGALDVLGVIEGGQGYEDLLPHTVELEIRGHAVRVLGLEKIVELKRSSTHPKDRQVLPILEETLARLKR